MAIRKDIDDMLNNLMSNPEPTKKAAPAPQKPVKKNKYDNMSVDDLLSALTGEKKDTASETANELMEEFVREKPVAAPVRTAAPVKHAAAPVKPAETAPAVPQETKFEEVLNVISSSQEKAEPAPAPAPAPKKKKRIVISGELPDYEAIRQAELEKDRLAREAAAREKAEREAAEKAAAEAAAREKAEREAAEKAAAEAAAREKAEREAAEKAAAEAAAREKAEREAAEKAAAEAAAREKAEREAAEKAAAEAAAREKAEREAEEAAARELAEIEAAQQAAQELLQAEEAPAEESISGRILSDIESAEEYGDEGDGSPTAEELVDAALAALTEAANGENNSGRIISDIESDDEYGDEPDTVGDMIDSMREEAESAIAEIEAPAQEPDTVQESVPEEAPQEADSPADEAPAVQDTNIDIAVAQEKPKGRLASKLEKVLGEDPDELVAERSEKTEDDDIDIDVNASKGKHKKRLFAVLGVIFSVFAVIGMITVGSKAVSYFNRFTSGEVKKDGFTEAVYPAVIMDIEAFNSPSELSSERIITATIWSIIMDDSKISKYEKTFDVVAIPQVEIEKYAKELFGNDIPQLQHSSITSLQFYYDGNKQVYNVPLRPKFFSYSPNIKSVSKSGSEYTVTVEYMEEHPSWMEGRVSKTAEYKLAENSDGSYRICSMKLLSAANML